MSYPQHPILYIFLKYIDKSSMFQGILFFICNKTFLAVFVRAPQPCTKCAGNHPGASGKRPHNPMAPSRPRTAAFLQKYHCPGLPSPQSARTIRGCFGLCSPLPALFGLSRHEPCCSCLPECSRMTGMKLSMFLLIKKI